MPIAHAPTGYLIGVLAEYRVESRLSLVAAGVAASLVPDLDMLWFHVIDHGFFSRRIRGRDQSGPELRKIGFMEGRENIPDDFDRLGNKRFGRCSATPLEKQATHRAGPRPYARKHWSAGSRRRAPSGHHADATKQIDESRRRG